MNRDKIENLISYADELDLLGLHKEADQIGWIIKRIAIHSNLGFQKNASMEDQDAHSEDYLEEDSINKILESIKLLSQSGRDTVLSHIIAMDEESYSEE